MSLDVSLSLPACEHCGRDKQEVYESNITHNLTTMAAGAGIYEHLWRPEEIGIKNAHQLIQPLRDGLVKLQENREKFSELYNPENGWGNYSTLVSFVSKYLEACEKYPKAEVYAWR